MGVQELEKPANQECSHLCSNGCGIYARRPVSCQAFKCWWLQGALGDDERPDKVGFVIHDGSIRTGHAVYIQVGALADPEKVDKQVKSIGQKHLVVVLEGDTRRLGGPPDKLSELIAEAKNHRKR
jgi:Fe-S-cluster containining protein